MILAVLAMLASNPETWTPAEALSKLRLPEGLVAELVAHEPNVESPVAISFDEHGRMFVAEYRDYPNGPPKGEKPLSRIRLLSDKDGDGFFETATVFADNLSFAQGVLAWNGGVIVTAAPVVLFLKDEDGDGKADRREVLLEGFKEGNPQLRVSHPRLGMDGWVYLSNGLSGGTVNRPGGDPKKAVKLGRHDLRFHPQTLEFEPATGFGQFGNTFDDFGRRFSCSNRNPVIHSFIPWRALQRNPAAPAFDGYADVAPAGAETRIYPLIGTNTTAVTHAGTHTAACGVWIYRGDLLGPDFAGNVFVCDPTGYLATRSKLIPDGCGFRTERDRPGQDFLAATDPWFRPVSLADGPDGALYVVDMHRENIEHPEYMPKGVAEKLRLRAGADKGRILRIRPKKGKPRKFAPPKADDDLVALLSDPNGWRRDLGQRLLVERKAVGAEQALKGMLRSRSGWATRIDRYTSKVHALWTLHQLGLLRSEMISALIELTHDSDFAEAVLHLLEERPHSRLLQERTYMLAVDPRLSPRVRMLLATTESAEPTAIGLGVTRDPFDPWIGKACLTSVAGTQAALTYCVSHWKQFSPSKAEFLTAAAAVVVRAGRSIANSTDIAKLLEQTAGEGLNWKSLAVLAGLAEGFGAKRSAFDQVLETHPKVQGIVALARKLVADESAPVADRLAAVALCKHLGDAPELLALVGSRAPEALQSAAIAALPAKQHAALAERLLNEWKALSPGMQSAGVEFFFRSRELQKRLFEAIAAGKVPASCVSPERREIMLVFGPDDELKRLAKKIFGAADPNRQAVIDRYAAALRTPGDATRGQAVFKRVCVNCHRLDGVGIQVGPELADVRQKPAETLLTDILDPNRAVEPRWAAITAVLADGRVVAGLHGGESGDAIVLLQAEGKRESIPRAQIEKIAASGKSLMPEGVEKEVTPEQMADLIAFLQKRQ